MLLQQLKEQGVLLKTDGENLSIKIDGELTEEQYHFLKEHKLQLIGELQTSLSDEQETKIRSWLEYISETDSDIITEIVERCRDNMEAKEYFLRRSHEAPKPASRMITCGDCKYYKRIDHPHLGNCAKGQPESTEGLWDSSQRYCPSWLPQSPN